MTGLKSGPKGQLFAEADALIGPRRVDVGDAAEEPADTGRRLYVRPPEPRFFDQATAAAYLGVGNRSFEALWRKGAMPQPHRLGRRLVWDRRALDNWADTLLAKHVDTLG